MTKIHFSTILIVAVFLVLIATSAVCLIPSSAQTKEDTTALDLKADKKEKFELGLKMLKEYYDAMDSRIEKSVALFLLVIGWLLTSESARKSLASEGPLFWGAIIALTLLVFFLSFNVHHFQQRFLSIRAQVNALNYMEPAYYTRYESMPQGALLFYLVPVFVFYGFIVLLLTQIRYNFLSVKGHRLT